MSIDKAVDSTLLDGALKASADEIRVKTGDEGKILFDLDGGTGFRAAIAAIQAGSGGGISMEKFIDVDVTVAQSTTTAVSYTVDDLELISSVKNPANKNSVFSVFDTYLAVISPKVVTGTPAHDVSYGYVGGIYVMAGAGASANNVTNVTTSRSVTQATSQGLYGLKLTCTAIESGKATGYMTLSARNNNLGAYEVVAGTYNVKVYHLTDYPGSEFL